MITFESTSSHNGQSRETHFDRGEMDIKVLRDLIMPQRHTPSILIVGPGIESDTIFCPHTPYKIAAQLEEGMNAGRVSDYTMTIVDLDPFVTADIERRKKSLYQIIELQIAQ